MRFLLRFYYQLNSTAARIERELSLQQLLQVTCKTEHFGNERKNTKKVTFLFVKILMIVL